jgi:hypothetical protein
MGNDVTGAAAAALTEIVAAAEGKGIMSKIVKVRLTEFFPFQTGLTRKQRKMEGPVLDRMDKPLYSLEDYLEGKAPYVSLACDSAGGPPGNVAEFRKYGYRVWLPEISASANQYTDTPVMLPIMIDFRLVDTGDAFTGKTKLVPVAGYEPIDVCRRAQPPAEKSLSGTLTELWLIGPP